MSDRFLFRAWISEEQFMTNQLRHYTTDHGMWQWFDEDEWNNDYPNHNKTGKSYWHDLTEDDVLMQCTGRKDKSGVLIYEGDAWVTKEPIDDAYGECAGWLEFIRVVKWSNEMAGFVVHETSEDPNMETETYPLNEFKNHDGNLLDFNVTHNIYKNPELLELTND